MAAPDPSALERLARHLDAGTLRAPIQRSYVFEQAGEALGSLPTTHSQGKLALSIG